MLCCLSLYAWLERLNVSKLGEEWAPHFSISARLFLPWNNVGFLTAWSTAISCPSILAFMINNLITSRNIRVYATTYIHKFLDLTARNHDSKCTAFLGHVIISMQPPRFWCKYAKHMSNQNINVLKCVNILMWDSLCPIEHWQVLGNMVQKF